MRNFIQFYMTNKAGRHEAIISNQTYAPQIPWQPREWSQSVHLITLLFIFCLAGQLESTGYRKHFRC